jgi:hypothetical protein
MDDDIKSFRVPSLKEVPTDIMTQFIQFLRFYPTSLDTCITRMVKNPSRWYDHWISEREGKHPSQYVSLLNCLDANLLQKESVLIEVGAGKGKV